MRALQSFSQRAGKVSSTSDKPAWPDVPYHFYIDVTGRIAEGRDVNFAGDTNTSYNPAGYLQVVLEGNFDKHTPAPEQLAALRLLLVGLIHTFDLGTHQISVHSNHASTDCPGSHFMSYLPQILAEVAKARRGSR
jgi:hypothetical protein